MHPNLPPIFVLNLARSADRRAHMAEQMRHVGAPYEFVEAVDGRALTDADVSAMGVDLAASRSFMVTRAFTPGEIGCALSHLKAYARILEENLPAACILEDDAVLADDFADVLRAAAGRFDWEMLLLGHYSNTRRSPERGGECMRWSRRLTPRYRIARPVEFPYLAIGYMIRPSAARKLREAAYPVRMPADALTGRAEKYGVRLRLLTPPCVVPKAEFVKNSTIGERRGDPAAVPGVAGGGLRGRANRPWLRPWLLTLRKLGLLSPPYRRNFLPETDPPGHMQD